MSWGCFDNREGTARRSVSKTENDTQRRFELGLLHSLIDGSMYNTDCTACGIIASKKKQADNVLSLPSEIFSLAFGKPF